MINKTNEEKGCQKNERKGIYTKVWVRAGSEFFTEKSRGKFEKADECGR